MGKIGVSLNINVTKLDKTRFFKGNKGTYCDMTVFIDLDAKDQYGQNGIIKQSQKKGEEADLPILGGCKIFWKGESGQATTKPQLQELPPDEDVPF